MEATSSLVTNFGAAAPGTSTAPMTRSAVATASVTAIRFEAMVRTAPPNCWSIARSVGRLMSSTVGGPTSGDTTTQDHHIGRRHPGHTAQQHPSSALGTQQVVAADSRRQPTGDLAHRRQQRQRPIEQLDGFVGQ
ncbi:Uncharacterised protein [Mycobacteroides abscessus subsp. abscessus]|nr:Uncharacterised protein [Mycobacteroides abscessus subsp. abscessus]